MKTADLLKNLPTTAELMENPRVRAVIDRLNPTVVTARVRGFLDEVRSEVTQRADAAGMPSLSELADRVSRYLVGDGPYHLGGAINATGQFHSAEWLSTPLADAAIERMLITAQDFSTSKSSPVGTPDKDAVDKFCQLTSAPSALVIHSHACAMELVLRSLPAPARVVIARGEVASVQPGCRLTDLAAAAGASLCEVGAVDHVTLNDYESALPEGGVLLRMASASGLPDAERPTLRELAAVAKRRGATLLVECGGASVADIQGLALTTPTIREVIEAGADLVLVRGDGLIGGPACGIVAGQSASVEQVAAAPLCASYRVDPLRGAALAATLELLSDPDKARLNIPVISLATAPLDNLRTRAERLAPQIAQCKSVREASAEERTAGIGGLPCAAPSWAVRVVPSDSERQPLLESLQRNTPPIRCRQDSAGLLLDLRTVFPRQDLSLTAFFADSTDSTPEEPPAGPADPPAP